MDLNHRPSGYEPDELPDCSIPQYSDHTIMITIISKTRVAYFYSAFAFKRRGTWINCTLSPHYTT